MRVDLAIAIQAEKSHVGRSLERALAAARTAENNRGRDIVVLDLRELTCVFDYFVLVTGASRRQLHGISEEIDQVLEQQFNDHRLGIEGYADSRWILLDFGDVVIHMFDEETRQYYDLENLWSGAKRVPFESSPRVMTGMVPREAISKDSVSPGIVPLDRAAHDAATEDTLIED
jgi:ribosome-associated protein